MGTPLQVAGKQFSRLTAICPIAKRHNKIIWLCSCECGGKHEVVASQLIHGAVKSCGCLKSERASRMKLSHGEAGRPMYLRWIGMKQRCSNPSQKDFKSYGGRGISVCAEWVNDFARFMHDMGQPPTQFHSIDRIDSNGNYEPNNCRWATASEQARNKRGNTLSMPVARKIRLLRSARIKRSEISKITGVSLNSIKHVLAGETWKEVL